MLSIPSTGMFSCRRCATTCRTLRFGLIFAMGPLLNDFFEIPRKQKLSNNLLLTSIENALADHKQKENEVRSHLSFLRSNPELVPSASDVLDDCRRGFNQKLKLQANNQVVYLTALARHFNIKFGLSIRGPQEQRSSVMACRHEIVTLLDECDLSGD